MKYGIVTDSSSDYKNNDIDLTDIDFTVVPLTLNVGTNVIVDDDDFDADNLLEFMDKEKEASRTACPSPGDFQKAFEKSDIVFCFCMTGELSGTYNSARIAREIVLSESEHKNKKIFILDSQLTAGALIALVEETIRLIQKDLTFEEISSGLTEYQKNNKLIFILGNYDNLIKSGRMSSIKGKIASKLHINLICEGKDGKIVIHSRVRGLSKSYKKMVDIIFESEIHNNILYINHVKNLSNAELIKKMIQDRDPKVEVKIRDCKGITTFYAGKNGILIGY